jgi:hypothetical protein
MWVVMLMPSAATKYEKCYVKFSIVSVYFVLHPACWPFCNLQPGHTLIHRNSGLEFIVFLVLKVRDY